jgi:hypothetical protein
MCVVWQHLTYKTKRKTPQATSAKKQRNRGAILFDRGVTVSLLRDMLSAGVVDCLAGEFDDAKVSVLCCVLSVRSPLWQILQIR